MDCPSRRFGKLVSASMQYRTFVVLMVVRAAGALPTLACMKRFAHAGVLAHADSSSWLKSLMAASALSCSLLAGTPQIVHAEDLGSPVAKEVVGLIDKYYLDRSFNGVDLGRIREQLDQSGPLTESQALELSEKFVKSLGDRYSRVLTPLQAAKLGKYDVTGVGINLVIADNGEVKVGAVPPADSDAGRLGVTFGDVVTAINGKAAVGMTSFDALEAIQGDGDTVYMRIKSDGGKGDEREVALKKSFLTKNPVTYRLVVDESTGKKTGYLKLSEFNAQCKRRVRSAVTDLESQGASGIILDLRGNGGGVLDGALGIAGLFVERPLVLYVTDANGAMQPLYSREQLFDATVPLQIWVDQGTASSSEVLAAALRDNCRASVVGGTTYGKGLIQGVFGLSDGGALIETVASYSTPAGDEINKKGVQPDVKKTFVSDVLGSSFVDQDIKTASFSKTKRTCVMPEKSAPRQGKVAANEWLGE